MLEGVSLITQGHDDLWFSPWRNSELWRLSEWLWGFATSHSVNTAISQSQEGTANQSSVGLTPVSLRVLNMNCFRFKFFQSISTVVTVVRLQPPHRWSSLLMWEMGLWRWVWKPVSLWMTTAGTVCGLSATLKRLRYVSTSTPSPHSGPPLTDTFICSSTVNYS